MDILVGAFHDRLQVVHFDPLASSLSLSTIEGVSEPVTEYSWLIAVPNCPERFYASQVKDPRYQKDGSISLLEFSKSPAGYNVAVKQVVHSGGEDPCHVGVSRDGSKLAIANYDSSAIATYRLNPRDGSIDENSYKQFDLTALGDFTPGPNQPRQDAPHPHGCFYDSRIEKWIVPDLGSDKLRLIDPEDGQTGFMECTPGPGPRHIVVHPAGRYIYAVNELSNTIAVHDHWAETRSHDALALSEPPKLTLSVLASGSERLKGLNAAAILLSKDARTVYVTNRLEGHAQGDLLVWFSVSGDGGELSRRGELRLGFDHPRAAQMLEYEGNEYLITGSKTGRGAVVYVRDDENGDLREVARNSEVQRSSCFLPLAL